MREYDIFKNSIKGIKDKTPIVFMEKAAEIFSSIYTGEVYDIDPNNKEQDIKDLREYISTLPDYRYVVIKDLGILSKHYLSNLLKLIEESNLKFIFLTYKDNLDPIFLSRMKYVVKIPYDMNTNNTLQSISETLKNSVDNTDTDIVCAEECPDLYSLNYLTRYCKLKNKYINFLGG
jgi:hypothetical protein